jgi:hypothetical protein
MDGLDLSIKNILLLRRIRKIRNISENIRKASTMRDTLAFSFIANTIQKQ